MIPQALAQGRGLVHTEPVGTLVRACAVCPIGLEKVLSRDLAQWGYRENGRDAGRIFFDIPLAKLDEHLARANIGLRTADRVMIVAGEFSAVDFDGFYEGIRGMPWELFCTRETRLIVERARAHECCLHAQATLQSMAQKAVYDALMERFHLRSMPESGPVLELRLYGHRDRWQVVVDSSGEALSRRGYRKHTHSAPLRETIAAAMLFLSGWKRARPLLDPFCGSGTIAIEAALYARNQAPGLKRRFAFETWPSVNPARVGEVREYFRRSLRTDVHTDITARDIDPAALALARANAELAGVASCIRFEQANALEAVPDPAYSGVLLANPPYGQRMGSPEEAEALAGQFGAVLGRFAEAGWDSGIITADALFSTHAMMRPHSIREIVVGQERLYFNWFPGHPDSMKAGKASGQPR